MLWRGRLGFALLVGATALVLAPGTAHAQYLDPGAGSIIVQAILAVAVGLMVGMKVYWGKIASFLTPKSKSSGRR